MLEHLIRRWNALDPSIARLVASTVAVIVTLLLTGLLFLPFHADPVSAYWALLREGFGTLRGFSFTLTRAAPLILVALGTSIAWRSGLGYLGFEGCFLTGAVVTTALALQAAPAGVPQTVPPWLVVTLIAAAAFSGGGLWAGLVAWLRGRFGGSAVLMSLMTNYLAALLVQWLVSGPMRAPGDLAQSPRLPASTWLPIILPGTRAHAGILVAMAGAVLVWLLLSRTLTGYELIVTGQSPRAAAYGGILVRRRQLLAGALAGGCGALAGFVEVLGVQHRLLDGLAGGTGYLGIVVALLARLNPLAIVPTAMLYAAMNVGADAMQRNAGIPASVMFILQSLIVLAVLSVDVLLARRRISPAQRRSKP